MTQPDLWLSKQQRGPTLKIIITILKLNGDDDDTQTEIINVKDMADVILKFKSGKKHDLIPSIRMRKNAGAPSGSTILIKISKHYNKQFLCSDEWLEAEMQPKRYDYSAERPTVLSGKDMGSILTWRYYIEVDITVHLLGSTVMLPNYNLYEDTEFTDFELQGTDGKVAVHKITLIGQSDVFKTIMRGEWKEKAEGHMKIEGVTVQTLQHLKEYMYLGTLPDEGLDLLLVVAARYLMDTLTSVCITKLVESMNTEDFDGLIKLACQHNIPGLVRALVLRTPDDVANGVEELKINDREFKDNDDSKDKDESKNNEG